MKKSILLLLAVIGFFLLPSSKVLAQAQVVDSHYESDHTGTLAICNGTIIDYTVSEVFDSHDVFNKNRVNTSIHTRADFSGTDRAGNMYGGSAFSTISENMPTDKGAYSYTVVYRFNFIGQGSAPNYIVSYSEKYTVNAKGEVTVDRTNLSSSCG